MIEQHFVEWSMAIGVDRRIALAIGDCDRAIAAYPGKSDQRWLCRIQDQRARLRSPDLPLIVALITALCEETPSLAPLGVTAIKELALKYPSLRPFQARLALAAQDRMSPPLRQSR